MPSTGTPSSSTAGSSCGAPSSYSDDGPPLRMIARGSRARQLRRGRVIRQDLREDPELAHPPGDELGDLRTEVEDDEGLVPS
jgi:hypothetical protein